MARLRTETGENASSKQTSAHRVSFFTHWVTEYFPPGTCFLVKNEDWGDDSVAKVFSVKAGRPELVS